MTLADSITITRIILAPIIFSLFISGNQTLRIAALVLFVIGALSDFWDGYIARRTKLSEFGKLWDPIADKILTGLALLALSVIKALPWWITISLIARDIMVTITRIVVVRKRGVIITPLLAAKLKTTFEMIMIIGLLFLAVVLESRFPPISFAIINAYGALVVFLSWVTGAKYIIMALTGKK